MPYQYFKHIASVVARHNGKLLLVQQQAPTDPLPSWRLPGGQVEPGEDLLVGLQRELLEETGLHLKGTPTLAFVVQVLRETEEGIQESLACHFACEVAGQISPQDPDGLVLSAHWVEERVALAHLGALSWYDCEPLRRWLCGEAGPGTVYTAKREDHFLNTEGISSLSRVRKCLSRYAHTRAKCGPDMTLFVIFFSGENMSLHACA